jgi:hypothetical protein
MPGNAPKNGKIERFWEINACPLRYESKPIGAEYADKLSVLSILYELLKSRLLGQHSKRYNPNDGNGLQRAFYLDYLWGLL